ncbi:uncharacterized protein BXZ73DRAFT_109857 [Epithele typhae]|uniref:uncharacterized protein n=1 Tax=Epithele typhae TaxID=378194 RepID=UPI002008D95F|nr:uncharacterized protein BXZ73DRAFT_109857 [Epithele typhae]KAH9908807.1 hypothetical protein BXZ73DRAFT_109857 [Epithele typhae]
MRQQPRTLWVVEALWVLARAARPVRLHEEFPEYPYVSASDFPLPEQPDDIPARPLPRDGASPARHLSLRWYEEHVGWHDQAAGHAIVDASVLSRRKDDCGESIEIALYVVDAVVGAVEEQHGTPRHSHSSFHLLITPTCITASSMRNIEPPISSLHKAKDLWYKDGTIVIVAGSTAFCVHSSVLEAVSSVFGDMLNLPQEGDFETMEGRIVVRVPDSEIDMSHFLRVVFRPGYDSLAYETKPIAFSALASFLRMAHKYDVDKGFASVVDRLSRRFGAPLHTSLGHRTTWDKVEAHLNASSGVTFDPADAIEAVNLMRLINSSATGADSPPRFADTAVAVALFYCCVAADGKPQILRNGWARADGTTEVLNDADFGRCVTAMVCLRQEFDDVVGRAMVAFWENYDNFKDDVGCSRKPQSAGGRGPPGI